jgi:nanoRNase/pAp phosphatase (c-di-AMP/oligoRNAs hydrolase)
VWKRFGDEVEFYPGVYGEAPPDVTGRDVILVDFSYKAPVIAEMGDKARTILILDHHKSAQAELEGLAVAEATWEEHLESCGDSRHTCALEKTGVQFDMSHSGAVLAWRYFHPGKYIPRMLLHVEDRDLWRFHLAQTRAITAAIFSREYDFKTWSALATACNDTVRRAQLEEEGNAILRKQDKDVAELIENTRRVTTIGGYKVPVANIPYTLASDAGNKMSVGHPFAATYYDGRVFRHFSLRSQEDGVDVSEVAQKYGGGGHARAAGFQVELGWDGDPDWCGAEVP